MLLLLSLLDFVDREMSSSQHHHHHLDKPSNKSYAFGSSTPREMSHLPDGVPRRFRAYDSKSPEPDRQHLQPSISDYMRRARRDAPSPKGAARRDLSIDTYNWAFGSSTPRELSYLCAIPPEYRVYNVRLEAIRKMILPTNQQRVRSRSHQTHLMASARAPIDDTITIETRRRVPRRPKPMTVPPPKIRPSAVAAKITQPPKRNIIEPPKRKIIEPPKQPSPPSPPSPIRPILVTDDSQQQDDDDVSSEPDFVQDRDFEPTNMVQSGRITTSSPNNEQKHQLSQSRQSSTDDSQHGKSPVGPDAMSLQNSHPDAAGRGSSIDEDEQQHAASIHLETMAEREQEHHQFESHQLFEQHHNDDGDVVVMRESVMRHDDDDSDMF